MYRPTRPWSTNWTCSPTERCHGPRMPPRLVKGPRHADRLLYGHSPHLGESVETGATAPRDAGTHHLTGLDMGSGYTGDILPPLIVAGLGLGLVMAPAMSPATAGVGAENAGAASATVNAMQQVGGSIGTALLNTLATGAATDYVVGKDPRDPAVQAQAGLEAYSTACWWSAVFFAAGLIVRVLLYRRSVPATDPDAAPCGAHVRSGSEPFRPRVVPDGPPDVRRAVPASRNDQGDRYGVVVVSDAKPSRSRIGRLVGIASTWR